MVTWRWFVPDWGGRVIPIVVPFTLTGHLRATMVAIAWMVWLGDGSRVALHAAVGAWMAVGEWHRKG